MSTFVMPALSASEQIDLLLSRGMSIVELAEAEHCLRWVGFHRLSNYWSVFQYRDGSEKHGHFRPRTKLMSIVGYDCIRRHAAQRELRAGSRVAGGLGLRKGGGRLRVPPAHALAIWLRAHGILLPRREATI